MNRITSTVCSLVFLIGNLSAQNQVVDPGFEEKSSFWVQWGAEILSNTHDGGNALKMANITPKWSGTHQVMLMPAGVTKVEVVGWMKTVGVVIGERT